MEWNDTRVIDALGVVQTWLVVLETRDVDAVLEASSAVVVLVGPRGEMHGHDALRAWMAASSYSATTLRWYAGPDTVVVEQLATWTPSDPELDAAIAAVRVATAFSVLDGLVTRVERFGDLDAALHEAWLTRDDAVTRVPDATETHGRQ